MHGELNAGGARCGEQLPDVRDRRVGHGRRTLVGKQHAQQVEHLAQRGGFEQAVNIPGVFVDQPVGSLKSFAELVHLGDQQRRGAGDVDDYTSRISRLERDDLDGAALRERAFDTDALSRSRVPVITRKASSSATGLRCDMRRHDEVDRNDDVVREAWAQHVMVPDARLAAVLKACIDHGVGEQWERGEPAWVESEVGVGGEGLISGQSAGGANVDGLRAASDAYTMSSSFQVRSNTMRS